MGQHGTDLDAASGKELFILRDMKTSPPVQPLSAQFSPDGQQIVTVADKTAQI